MTRYEKILHHHFIGKKQLNLFLTVIILIFIIAFPIISYLTAPAPDPLFHQSANGDPPVIIYSIISIGGLVVIFSIRLIMVYKSYRKAPGEYDKYHYLADLSSDELNQYIHDTKKQVTEQYNAIDKLEAEKGRLRDEYEKATASLQEQIDANWSQISGSPDRIELCEKLISAHQV